MRPGTRVSPECALLELAGHPRTTRPAERPVARHGSTRDVRIAIAGHLVYDGSAGGPSPFDKAAAQRARWTPPEVLIRVDLGLGDGTGEAFGCDLTEDYVRENSEYTT